MFFSSSYYQILEVSVDSTYEEIKKSFRRLSLVHHPDKNNNSPESNTHYAMILNAYSVLADPVRREKYDAYIRRSSALAKWSKASRNTNLALQGLRDKAPHSTEALLSHLNFLLWDIEDLISERDEPALSSLYGKVTFRQIILKILTFIDKWVLEPSGNLDYFMEARQMKRSDPRELVNTLGSTPGNHVHSPYVSILDYFYDVRKRTDTFIERVTAADLISPVPNQDIRLIDCIVEAQNLAIHYLSYLLQIESGMVKEIPPFSHSHPCFIY